MDPVIDIHKLTKRYGQRTAVSRLSLEVPEGAIFALLGENGAGKSTTIKMLTGLVQPDEGWATILDQDCWSHAVRLRRRIGYVPERPRFYDWMTVGEIGWFTAGFHQKGFLGRYRELTDHFELDPRARLQFLSKGQYAKVGLALALASDPRVLLLDEPTSGLDLLVRREFLASMVALAGKGRTILISSHQVAEIERIASHVAFLSHGRLLLSATLDELRERLVRVQLRAERLPPDPRSLGTLLQRNGTGKQQQWVVLDPDQDALKALHVMPGLFDVDVTPLNLEEAYCVLLEGKEELP
jgi:ABC-2 type transport system ATP-binding protein